MGSGARIAQSVQSLVRGPDDPGFDFWKSTRIFVFCKMSRPALEPKEPPIQWVAWTPSLGIKDCRVKLITHLLLPQRFRMSGDICLLPLYAFV